MSEKKKGEKPQEENKKKDASAENPGENVESFDVNKVDFDTLDEKGKKEVFEKLKNQNGVLIGLVQSFTKEVEELEAKAQGKMSDESYKRLAADFENFKRRNATAVSAAYQDGKFEVVKGFIDIIDNIERAIASIPDEASRKGVELIKKQTDEILTKFNVKEIDALNKPFDPNFHHAVMQGEAKSPEEVDTCIEVFQKGYEMDGKVLRYSFVKVAK